MRQLLLLSALALLFVVGLSQAPAQWQCLYATWDEETNGTGYQVFGVGVIKENMFVALVTTRGTRNFMVPYVDADSSHGRTYYYGYGTATTLGIIQAWYDGGFDQVAMNNAFMLRATADSNIYIANNDPRHNILVFKYTQDTITVVEPFPRTETGDSSVFGIDVDASGRVYVCADTANGLANDLRIYAPYAQWTAGVHTETPIRTINLPDGIYKGIAVTPTGSAIFISDYKNRKVLKYTGTPGTGYTLAAGFNFSLGPKDTLSGTPTKRAGPIGIAYLASKNIVAVACDSIFKPSGGTNYEYGRIYLLNGNTGALISADTSMSVIDQAAWNLAVTGAYNDRGDGTAWGNASGYTYTTDVKWDEKGFLYSNSVYGWTVEKWKYNGTLPSFTTGVEPVESAIPEGYTLSQNYPNPFNPTTEIVFTIPRGGMTTMKVYDVLGKEIMTLVNENMNPGTYRAKVDGSSLASGTYIYTLISNGVRLTNKMMLVK